MTTVLKAIICLDVIALSTAFLAVSLYLCRYLRIRIALDGNPVAVPATQSGDHVAPATLTAAPSAAETPKVKTPKVKLAKKVKPAKVVVAEAVAPSDTGAPPVEPDAK